MITPDVRHQHLIVRAEISAPPIATDTGSAAQAEAFMEGWVSSLISRIGMKTMYGPKAKYCFVEGNRGMTAFAIIETSHICLHFWDECDPSIIQLDVYTCSDLVVDDVLSALETFRPTKLEWKFLDREHNLTLVGEGSAQEPWWKAIWDGLKGFLKVVT